MPLVERVAQDALDEEYADVAARRVLVAERGEQAVPGGSGRAGRRPGPLAAVMVVVFAVLVTTSFVQTRASEDVTTAGRGALEQRVLARRVTVARAQDRVVELRAANTADEAGLDVLTQASAQASARLARLGTAAGFSARTGEGVRIEVDDPTDGVLTHRVYDADLALLANGLWQAGAEAISVNGQRLTVLSAFRFAGVAIRLNRVSLSPPYTVLALGDTRTLAADLLDTTSGLRFAARAEALGWRLSMHNEQRLTVPAASSRLLRDVRAAQTGVAADQDAPSGKERSS